MMTDLTDNNVIIYCSNKRHHPCHVLTYLLKKFVNIPCSKANAPITSAIFIKSCLLGSSSFVSLLLNLPML